MTPSDDDSLGRSAARAPSAASRTSCTREYPELAPAWLTFRDVRAKRRAVEWLLDEALVLDEAAHTYLADHPDPPLP